MLKTTKQRIYATVILTIFFVALIIGAISFNGLSYNTKLHTKDIATASDLVLDNYVADEYQSQTPATSRSIIIRSEWNGWLENINTWATSVTEVEDDLYVFTFDTANDAYLAMMRVYGESDYCFETVFDVSDDLNDVETEVFDTIVSNESDVTMKPVTIAVLDTGYSGNSDKVLKGFSLIEGSSNIKDNNGHGTRLIDIIDSMTYDNVKILPIKVANKDGFATILSVYSGIKLAIEQGVDVINISLNANSSERSFLLEEAINEATSKGITVVVSAGNKSSDIANIVPANIDKALVVSAVNIHDTFEYYSNYGTTIDYATYGNYHGIGGTSIAAARMSAMVAYKFGLGEDVTVFRNIAYNPTGATWDEYYGYGIVNPVNVYGNELATDAMNSVKAETETTWVGKTDYDIGPDIVHLDWKTLDTETLDKYLIETHYAFVGSLLATLSDEEMEEFVAKSEVAKGTVEEVEFQYELDVPETDANITSSRSVDFVTYCLEEYNYRKDDLTISSDFWWYDGNGNDTTADGELWLKDKSGETCFRIYAPQKYYNGPSDKTTAKWGPQSVNSSDTSDGYMKMTKVATPGNVGPVIAATKIIQSGYQNFISFSTKENEITGTVEQIVTKSPLVSAEKMDTGESSTVWQFTFANYDVGDAPVGEHWATSEDYKVNDQVFESHLYAEHDPNVRPYGYWHYSEDYWTNNPTAKPSGKRHDASECTQAEIHFNDPDWRDLLGTSLEKWDNTRVQNYAYTHIGDMYKDTVQSVRWTGYWTTKATTLDSLHYWYFDGASLYDQKNVVNSPLQTYKGETTKTKYLVQKKYPSAKFIQINHINGLAYGDEERWLPLFSSNDFPGVESMMELGKCAPYWYYKYAYNSDAGLNIDQSNSDINEGNESSFINDNIAVRGLLSSYDSDNKTVQIVGGWQSFGLSCVDYNSSGEGLAVGPNATLATESDIPELYIQSVPNKLTVQYSVALSEENMSNKKIFATFNTNKQPILNQCITDVLTYGETYNGNANFKPSISNFTADVLQIDYYSKINNTWKSYTGSSLSIKQIVNGILDTPNESGGTLYITRIYKPKMSTVVVNPGSMKWKHDGDGDGEKELYTGSNLYIESRMLGDSIPIEAPIAESIIWTAKCYNVSGSIYKNEEFETGWDRVKGWVLEKGTLEGVLLGDVANGTIKAGGEIPNGGANYMKKMPLLDMNYFLTVDGTKTGGDLDADIVNATTRESRYFTSMKQAKTLPAGFYEINITTGGAPAAMINGVTYSSNKGNPISNYSPLEFTSDWTLDSSIARGYEFKTSYPVLDENGGAPFPGGSMIYNTVRALPLDYIYTFGSVVESVDVLKPAEKNPPLFTLPSGPIHPSSNYTFKEWKCLNNGECYAAGEVVLLSDLVINDEKTVEFKPVYNGEICTITLKGETVVKGENITPTTSNYTKTLYAYKGTNEFYTTKTMVSGYPVLRDQYKITSAITIPKYTNYKFSAYEKDGIVQVDDSGNIIRETPVMEDETWVAKVELPPTFDTGDGSKYIQINLDTNGITPYNDDVYDTHFKIKDDGFYYTKENPVPTSQVVIPESLNYNFVGYYTTKYGINANLDGVKPIIDANGIINKTYDWFIGNNITTLYAAWMTPFGVTLNFNHDGQVEELLYPEKFEIAHGGSTDELMSFPYTPQWTGHVFDGWYDAATGGNLVYSKTGEKQNGSKYWDDLGLYKGNTNMTLYAHWKNVTYKVSYNPGEFNTIIPNGTMSDSSHTYGTSKTLNKISYTLTMDILYDLNDSESGTTQASITKNTDSINGTFEHWLGDIKTANTLEINEHVGLFKTNGTNWNQRVVSVTNAPLNDNGIEDLGLIRVSCSNNNATATFNQTTGEITITSVREGACTVTVTSAATNKYAETSVTYYVYGRNTSGPEVIEVTLDANGGTCDKASIYVEPGQNYGTHDTLPTPTLDGFEFVGWSTSLAGITFVGNNTKVTNANPHTLFAIWRSNAVTVNFDPMGGKMLAESYVFTDLSGKTTEWTNTWCENPEIVATYIHKSGSGKKFGYIDGTRCFEADYTTSGDLYQYGVYAGTSPFVQQVPFNIALNSKITWVIDSSLDIDIRFDWYKTSSHSKEIRQGDTYDILPQINKTGQILLGWNTKSDGSGQWITEDTICSLDVDHTLYAIWRQWEYTLNQGDNISGYMIANSGRLEIESHHPQWGCHIVSYLPVDLTNYKTLKVYGGATRNGAYYVGGYCSVSPTKPTSSTVTNYHPTEDKDGDGSADWDWVSDGGAKWVTKDVSNLTGTYYICIGKFHWPGYVWVEEMYLEDNNGNKFYIIE